MAQSKRPKVRVTLVHKNGPQPFYATEGSMGLDLETTEDISLRPGEVALIPTNVIIDYPEGFVALLVMRSSAYKRYGITLANGIGIIDRDYNGPNDVVTIQAITLRPQNITIPAGSRIAQLLFVRAEQADIEIETDINESQFVSTTSRGGFGST